MKRSTMEGYSVAELAVVVAIVALLAGFLFPGLLEQQRKARRAEAQAALIESAQWMERFYAEHRRYDKTGAGLALAFPFDLRTVPRDRATPADYEIVFDTLEAHRYTLLARPTSRWAGDRCGALALDHTGHGASRVADALGCWPGR